MKRILIRESGSVVPVQLVAGAILALTAILGITVVTNDPKPAAQILIEPLEALVETGEVIEIQILVKASEPVNVFAGEIGFNPRVLRIESIDYNTSVADLWVDEPWYSNGEGTLTFGGGTTKAGGFEGKDQLILVKLVAISEGEGVISINDSKILKHDGLGTEVEPATAKAAILTVTNSPPVEQITATEKEETTYKVVKEVPNTDLNGDGKQSLADISIFMLNMAGNKPRFDFNLDGEVGLKDLNILLGA